ncbi:hypothetical protein NI35_4258 [Salmonella enterica subsp. enterica serovar Cerro]|nr:hypothetical protein GW13_PRO1739 [Salmonella enterica subsp. enterica serovar Cerro]KMN27972.1 hypothetical protein NI35_4258 [Salmonella enterica subsp. enterica serovar Cerro]
MSTTMCSCLFEQLTESFFDKNFINCHLSFFIIFIHFLLD